MKYLLMILILVGCGGEGTLPGDDISIQDTPADGLPVGQWYSVNGMLDYISVGHDGTFTMRRVGATSSGYVTSNGGNEFTLVIEAMLGNRPEEEIYNTQGVGTWNCKYSVSGSMFHVYCPGDSNGGLRKFEGNAFNPAMGYRL